MPYYHYTSRQGAQDILSSAAILPNDQEGKIYLTPDRYDIGYRAANELAIAYKPAELGFEIPDDRVRDPTGPNPVTRLPHPSDPSLDLRQGGGQELTISDSIHIDVSANPPQWFILELP